MGFGVCVGQSAGHKASTCRYQREVSASRRGSSRRGQETWDRSLWLGKKVTEWIPRRSATEASGREKSWARGRTSTRTVSEFCLNTRTRIRIRLNAVSGYTVLAADFWQTEEVSVLAAEDCR